MTSAGGSVREACLWSAALAQPGVRRRASVLDRGEVLTDADPDDCRERRRRGAGSSTRTARSCAPGWCGTTPPGTACGSSTPTSPTSPATGCRPGCAGSRSSTQLPLREKVLRQALSARDCGALEILVRGVDVDPDALRRRLRPRGASAAVAGDHPHRIRGRRADGGLRLPGLDRRVARVRWRRRRRGRLYSARTSTNAHTEIWPQCWPRAPCWAGPAIAVAGAQNDCAALGGDGRGRRRLPRPASKPTYMMDLRFPTDYPDEQAVVDYLTQNRDGFVNVAQTRARGTCPTRWTPPHRHSAPRRPRAWC